MQLELPYGILLAANADFFKKAATRAASRMYRKEDIDDDMLVSIQFDDVPDAAHPELRQIAEVTEDSRLVRALDAIAQAKAGSFDTSIPNFDAFMPMLKEYLRQNVQRGWVFREAHDGYLYPYLITGMQRHDPVRKEDGPPRITISMVAFGGEGRDKGKTMTKESASFEPSDVTRKKLASILSDHRLFFETDALLATYDAEMDYYRVKVRDGFAKQYVHTGKPKSTGRWGSSLSDLPKRKIIHDSPVSEDDPTPTLTESKVLEDDFPIPVHPIIRCFDLADHEFFWTHSSNLAPYVYDKTLRDKLVLPQSHRDLLDVLTTDLDQFLGDIVEGKSAGNIVICKGVPGVGKTLTAEIYSELIEKPMYSVHSGSLGTSAGSVEKNLKVIFQRQKRWGCVLLLDEADVFVVERGDNIEQNAIVAEFLRVLEYFDGLLFMTTNRPDSIDEAIISRAAAIIHYEVPGPVDRARIWEVMFTNYGQDVSGELIADLVDLFPKIAPRDIKMLLRLALRISTFHGSGITVETFRRCAMFRNVEIAPETDLV